MGKRELIEKDLPVETREREHRAISVINGFYAQIDEARERYEFLRSRPDLELTHAAKSQYAATLEADEEMRANMPSVENMEAEHSLLLDKVADGEIGISHGLPALINSTADYELMLRARDDYANIRGRRLAALRASFSTGETRFIEPIVEQYILDNNPSINRGSREWVSLSNAITRAEIEALERTIERDRGHFLGQPRDPLLTPPEPVEDPSSPSNLEGEGMTLSEARIAFHKERTAGGGTLASKTMKEHENAVRMFCEFVGGEIAVRLITKRQIIEYKLALLETPTHYRTRFPGLTLPQAIKANDKLDKPYAKLAPKTIIMKWLSHLSSVLQWASNNGHIEAKPAQGVRVDTGSNVHREPSYLPFNRNELKQIFGHVRCPEFSIRLRRTFFSVLFHS
ncbi:MULTISPECIES: hypothetical protein [unclassified Marinovum]